MSRAVILLPIVAGSMILSGVALPLYVLLRRDGMLTWGWRVPFLVASIVSLVPLWLLYSEGRETGHFEEMRRQRAAQDADPTGRLGAPATIDQGLLSMVQRTLSLPSSVLPYHAQSPGCLDPLKQARLS